MSSYTSMLQEIVEGLSRRGHSIEDRGPDWILVEDEDGRRFKVEVKNGIEESAVSGEVGEPAAAPWCYHAAILNQPCDCNKPPAPWRFAGLPAVPEHVTALEDPDGVLWVRQLISGRWGRWTKYSPDPMAWLDADWLNEETLLTRRAPLQEHPDPRAAP